MSAGSSDPIIYVDGSGFTPTSVASVNGSARTTDYISATRLKVNATALDVAAAGSVDLTVANVDGSPSGPRTLAVGPATYTVRDLMVTTPSDLEWDATRGRLYVLSDFGHLAVVEPISGNLQLLPVPGGSASAIALSDDGQYLYFADNNNIYRCSLPDLAVDLTIQIPLGASAVAVAPGMPRTLAVGGGQTVSIFDDDVVRQDVATLGFPGTASELTWGADASAIYARGEIFNTLYTLAVNAGGARVVAEQARVTSFDSSAATGIFFDRSQGRLHLGNGTQFAQVIDPLATRWAGRFDAPGLATVDPTTGKVFFLFYTTPANATIAAYDLTTYAFINSISFPQQGTGIGPRMVRYGSDGLAYVAGDHVYLINGEFVTARPSATTVVPNTSMVSGHQVMVLPQPADDLVWNPANQLIYLAVPGLDPEHGNSIVGINPSSGQVVSERRVLSDPSPLAISDDGTFLYAGLLGAGSIQRFSLPDLLPDATMPLGWSPFFGGAHVALDLGVAPGAPRTLAVSFGRRNGADMPQGPLNISIYDDATPRPMKAVNGGRSLHWGVSASTLFSADDSSPTTLNAFSVDQSGVQLSNSLQDSFSPIFSRIHYDSIRARIYSSNGGVVDATNLARVGSMGAFGSIAIDPALNRAWGIPQFLFPGSEAVEIRSVNLQTLATLSTLTLPKVNGRPIRLIRWGTNGLAFNTEAGEVYILSGPLVN